MLVKLRPSPPPETHDAGVWKPRQPFKEAIDVDANGEIIRYDLVEDSLGSPGGPVYKPVFRETYDSQAAPTRGKETRTNNHQKDKI